MSDTENMPKTAPVVLVDDEAESMAGMEDGLTYLALEPASGETVSQADMVLWLYEADEAVAAPRESLP